MNCGRKAKSKSRRQLTSASDVFVSEGDVLTVETEQCREICVAGICKPLKSGVK
jgi:hypothetical protein